MNNFKRSKKIIFFYFVICDCFAVDSGRIFFLMKFNQGANKSSISKQISNNAKAEKTESNFDSFMKKIKEAFEKYASGKGPNIAL